VSLASDEATRISINRASLGEVEAGDLIPEIGEAAVHKIPAVAGGSGAAVAFLMIKTFGDKWLDQKSKERFATLVLAARQ